MAGGTNVPMESGNESTISYRAPSAWGVPGVVIARCSMVSSGFCAPAPNGVICRNDLAPARLFMTASGPGGLTAVLDALLEPLHWRLREGGLMDLGSV